MTKDKLQEKVNELETKISNMYSVREYKEMKEKMQKEYDYLLSTMQATQIMLATHKGMVDIYERFTDTKEILENNPL